MKVLTIGGATQDVFIHYADAVNMHLCSSCGQQPFLLLESGTKVEIKDIHYATGGGATNSAVSFSRLGFDTSVFCKVGSDEQGKFIQEHLQKEGVSISPVIQTEQANTGRSFILPTFEGDRTILVYRGANSTIETTQIPMQAIANSELIYVTSLSGISSQLLLPITKLAKDQGIFVANNPGMSQLRDGAPILRDSLPYIDILILNTDEAKQLMLSLVQTNETLKATLPIKKQIHTHKPVLLCESLLFKDICFNLTDFFSAVLNRGPRFVVVTNGAEGVYAATNETVYFHPSFPVEIEHTTVGAGDAFGSCFTAMIAQGNSIEDALRCGIVNACSVIGHEDAKSGLLTKKDLEKMAKEIDPTLLLRI